MADPAEVEKMRRDMEKHFEHMKEFIEKICSLPNSKVMSEVKYNQIRAFLKDETIDLTTVGVPRSQIPKFKWFVKKKKEYELIDFPRINVVQAICVEAPKKVSYFFMCKSVSNRSSRK